MGRRGECVFEIEGLGGGIPGQLGPLLVFHILKTDLIVVVIKYEDFS